MFTVTLSKSSEQTITVDYAISNGSASADSDYTAIASTALTFMTGERSKQITVVETGETMFEVNMWVLFPKIGALKTDSIE